MDATPYAYRGYRIWLTTDGKWAVASESDLETVLEVADSLESAQATVDDWHNAR